MYRTQMSLSAVIPLFRYIGHDTIGRLKTKRKTQTYRFVPAMWPHIVYYWVHISPLLWRLYLPASCCSLVCLFEAERHLIDKSVIVLFG